MGHGVVADQQSGGAPYADRSGLDHRADLIALLPPRSFIGGQGRFARLVPLQVERADGAGHDEKRDTRPDQRFSGLQRGHGRRDGAEDDTRKQRSGSFEQRIDQRRVKVRRYLLIGFSCSICKLHFGRARVLFRCVLLPVADEVFLREHRYRDVVFRSAKTKIRPINQQARQGLPIRRGRLRPDGGAALTTAAATTPDRTRSRGSAPAVRCVRKCRR